MAIEHPISVRTPSEHPEAGAGVRSQTLSGPSDLRRPILTVKTSLQSQLIWLIFAALTVPTLIFGWSLYSLIHDFTSTPVQLTAVEMVMKTVPYVAVAYPVLLACILILSFHVTNRIVGPVDRLIREIGDRVEGRSSGPLHLRPGDALIPLVEQINRVLEDRERLKRPTN